MLAVAMFVAATGVALARQSSPSDLGSLMAALATEVRLLRLAVERSSQTQTETQALAVAISAQQSRLQQVNARAEALSREFDGVLREQESLRDRLTDLQVQEANVQTPANIKAELRHMVTEATTADARAATRVGEVRARLAEADAAVQAEIQRWNNLVARLEQATRP